MARPILDRDEEDDLPDLDSLFHPRAGPGAYGKPNDNDDDGDNGGGGQAQFLVATTRKGDGTAEKGGAAAARRAKDAERSAVGEIYDDDAEAQTGSSSKEVQEAGGVRRRRVVLKQRGANPLLLPLRSETGRRGPKVLVDDVAGGKEAVRSISSNRIAPVRSRRAKRHVVVVVEVAEDSGSETGVGDDSSSDGMSDFVVSDDAESFASETEEDEEVKTVPRSTRRLVRGLRPEATKNKKDPEKSGGLADGPTESLGTAEASMIDSVTRKDRERVKEGETVKKSTAPRNKPSFSNSNLLDGLADPFANLSIGPSLDRLKGSPRRTQQTTPPASPQKPGAGLASPSKKLRIPQTPHRPSMDSFWKQDMVNEWNDEYSPRKTLKTSQLPGLPSDDSSGEVAFKTSPRKSPPKKDKAALEAKRLFSERKNDIAVMFLVELDKIMTQGQIAALTASTGGVKIVWSKTLNTTAGRANWRREATKARASDQGGVPSVSYKHHASIELAEKVIDSEDRLLNTLAHEFCHLTTFMISNVRTNPHGKEFKAWASNCSAAFGHRGVEVTTKHSYAIEFKYIWECATCLLQYKRHSKSIDPARHRCSTCKSALVQIKPVPKANGTAVNQYQLFVKENMGKVREENPGSPQKVIMTLIGKKYQEQKVTKLAPVVAVEEVSSADESSDRSKDIRRRIDFLSLATP